MTKWTVKRALMRSGLYRPVRLALEKTVFHEAGRAKHRMAALYRQFIAPGQLVFEVGANIGRRTESFINLGARVVAFEPNPLCAAEIRCMFPRHSVTVETLYPVLEGHRTFSLVRV